MLFIKLQFFWLHNRPVTLVGDTVDSFFSLPAFEFPAFDTGIINHLLSVAFAVALLGIIETTCTAKAIAAASGHAISINQEILAVVAGNFVSAFTNSIPSPLAIPDPPKFQFGS